MEKIFIAKESTSQEILKKVQVANKNIKIFKEAGGYDWTPPEGVNTVYVSMIGAAGGGGGGGGGGGKEGAVVYAPSTGGGGGSGAIGEIVIDFPIAVDCNETYQITVGIGGNGGAGGVGGNTYTADSSTGGINGSTGGTTSFHNILSVSGGRGGSGGNRGNKTKYGVSNANATPPVAVTGGSVTLPVQGSIIQTLNLSGKNGGPGEVGTGLTVQYVENAGSAVEENIFGTKSGRGGRGGTAEGYNTIYSKYASNGENGEDGTDGVVILRW